MAERQIQRPRPKLHIQRSRVDEGLFENVDDHVIQQICTQMIQDQRYHDLSLLLQSNSRFKGACQGLLHDEHDRLMNLPPTLIKPNGTQEWLDSEGQRHRDLDLPAVIDDYRKAWYQHGQLHRDRDRPAIITHDGYLEWLQHGLTDRGGDMPAVIGYHGLQVWYSRDQIHRIGRPAVITPKYSMWIEHGVLQRINDYVLPHDIEGKTFIVDKQQNKITFGQDNKFVGVAQMDETGDQYAIFTQHGRILVSLLHGGQMSIKIRDDDHESDDDDMNPFYDPENGFGD